MRIIKYKPADSFEFRNFIDIGSCERDYYSIKFFLPEDHEKKSGKQYFKNYNSWFENFKNESIGSKMIIINYYLSEYLGWNNSKNSTQLVYFAEVYGAKTFGILGKNLNYLLEFHNKWFYYQSSTFRGLDLDLDDIEDGIINTKSNEDGIKSEIEFEDGSRIRFLDQDDSIKSFYVDEDDYIRLKIEIEGIVKLFE